MQDWNASMRDWEPAKPINLDEVLPEEVLGARYEAPDPIAPRLPPWRHKAACKGREADIFAETQAGIKRAKKLCAGCPVMAQCLSFAVDVEVTHGIWGGTTFADRTRICPICMGPKVPDALGCDFKHTLLRMGRLSEQQELGDPDVIVSLRQKPTARTNPECVIARGMSHSIARAYKEGCRCEAARVAVREERNAREGRAGGRGSYRVRETG